MGTVSYKIHLHEDSFQRTRWYQQALAAKEKASGQYFKRLLVGREISQMSGEEFLERLIRTKKPHIYAESQVRGDGSDWNLEELSILGDVGISMPVTVYDNGRWEHPAVHKEPFTAHLLFVPGALLKDDISPDWKVVNEHGKIDYQAYYNLYERRLLPLFLHANHQASEENRPALITVPGIGCGYFGGRFKSVLKLMLEQVLSEFLHKHIVRFPHIRAVYFDPHSGHKNNCDHIEHLSFLVRPLLEGNDGKPQLCRPQTCEEGDDDFSGCRLYSVVAWDHVSWPGNDFYHNSRHSDDGVKAAATSSMAVITGMEGEYNRQTNRYQPPDDYVNWEQVVLQTNVQLEVADNLTVVR